MAKGLDGVHPFSDTARVEIVLREAEQILSEDMQVLGRRNASRIWGFMSKFAMLDRFCKTLDVAKQHPGVRIPKTLCSPEYLGTGLKASKLFYICITSLRHLLVFRIS